MTQRVSLMPTQLVETTLPLPQLPLLLLLLLLPLLYRLTYSQEDRHHHLPANA